MNVPLAQATIKCTHGSGRNINAARMPCASLQFLLSTKAPILPTCEVIASRTQSPAPCQNHLFLQAGFPIFRGFDGASFSPVCLLI